MRRSIAMVGMPRVTAVAHAQSNVTLYGIVDTSLEYTNNQKGCTNYQIASGIDSTGKAAVAALWPVTASSNAHQIVAALGLRHRF